MATLFRIGKEARLPVRLARTGFISLLLVLLLGAGAWFHASAQNCSQYTVVFLGDTFDGANTTFQYRVCSNGDPAISHWVLGLPTTCAGCADVVAASRSYECGTDPTTHLFGVKFDQGFSTPQCRDYWITLRGYWPTSYTTAAVKAGPGNCFYQVGGPACPSPGQPGLVLEKKTNGVDANMPPGPAVPAGSTVTWTYEVTNTGDVPLTNIVVTDDQEGSIGTIPTLAPGASATLTKTGTAVAGQYGNVGTATTTYDGQTVTATDPSHYVGVDGYIMINPGQATNAVGNPHTFLITAYAEGAAPSSWTLNYTVTPTPGSQVLSGPTVAADGMSATWNLTINQPSPAVFTASATVTMTFAGGTQIVRTTNGMGNSSGPATKMYADARISVTPLVSVNPVGTHHTVTAQVETNTGAG